MHTFPKLAALLIGLWSLLFSAVAASAPNMQVKIVDDAQKYRVVQIDVSVDTLQDIEVFEVWYARQPFTSLEDAELHTQIRVADTRPLQRVDPGQSYDDCWTDGLPVHRDPFGMPIIGPYSKQWSCSLTGLLPETDYWFAVVPVNAVGIPLLDMNETSLVQGRTDMLDQLPAPPDTRPILTALSSIVITLIAILVFLRRHDARSGKASSKLAHVYVAPALIALALLSFYPIFYGIWLSFTDAHQSHLGQQSFNGIANFIEVFQSPGLLRVTLFTIIWSVANVTFHVAFGLLLAMVLTRARLKGKLFYRTVLLLPWAIPAYISILAWRGILGAGGLFNNILGTNIDFLSEVLSAQMTVILVNIWLGIPFMMMSISGALMGIPRDMFEAADLDGVSKWRQFRHLTLPNLKSTLTPLCLLGFIWSFNMFVVIYLMTRGNPSVAFGEPGATDILVTYVFDVAFEYGRYGVAAAYSVVIFLMLVGFSWAYMKKTKATESVS